MLGMLSSSFLPPSVYYTHLLPYVRFSHPCFLPCLPILTPFFVLPSAQQIAYLPPSRFTSAGSSTEFVSAARLKSFVFAPHSCLSSDRAKLCFFQALTGMFVGFQWRNHGWKCNLCVPVFHWFLGPYFVCPDLAFNRVAEHWSACKQFPYPAIF